MNRLGHQMEKENKKYLVIFQTSNTYLQKSILRDDGMCWCSPYQAHCRPSLLTLTVPKATSPSAQSRGELRVKWWTPAWWW